MTDDMSEKIILLLLGWLFGLLGPIIVDSIRRRRENSLGRVAIVSELNELAGTLAVAAYGARTPIGTVDRKFLEWLKLILEQHATTQKLQEFIPHLRRQLSATDEQLQKIAQHMSRDNGKGNILQHYPVPLLDARVSALWSFETNFQRKLLEIRRNIALLDDIVDRSRKYFDLTFSKIEGDTQKLVIENLNQTYELYAERAIIITDLIVSLKQETS